ncbi:MAG TPA: hypothetical protein VMK16_09185 [Acidimicrobiales bacterium]|nr:hypothetical protein [Acidimicrobiales bacterium]
MKIAIGIAIGWIIGARVFDSDYSDIVDALGRVGRSDELHDLVHTVRWHASQTLRDMADLLEAGSPISSETAVDDTDVVSRVTDLHARLAH